MDTLGLLPVHGDLPVSLRWQRDPDQRTSVVVGIVSTKYNLTASLRVAGGGVHDQIIDRLFLFGCCFCPKWLAIDKGYTDH